MMDVPENSMAYPIKICAVCSEEFELKPDKPGFANRCPACSTDEGSGKKESAGSESKANSEMNAARRQAMRDLLYRKEG
jgi:DNA-directed RNA polymerase subunit RPC12/RpoP